MKKIVLASLALAVGVPAQAGDRDLAGTPGYDDKGRAITNPAIAGYDPDLVVCRREAKIGSRVKSRKVCLTNKEWQRVAREGNAMANRMAEEGSAGLVTE